MMKTKIAVPSDAGKLPRRCIASGLRQVRIPTLTVENANGLASQRIPLTELQTDDHGTVVATVARGFLHLLAAFITPHITAERDRWRRRALDAEAHIAKELLCAECGDGLDCSHCA